MNNLVFTHCNSQTLEHTLFFFSSHFFFCLSHAQNTITFTYVKSKLMTYLQQQLGAAADSAATKQQ